MSKQSKQNKIKIQVQVHGNLPQAEIDHWVADAVERWARRGRELEKIIIREVPGTDELDITEIPVPLGKIVRIRRITGYLAEVDQWNAAKKAELAERIPHTG
ncbi:anaerobic ribonucleoside-triphosphate reductase [Desulfurispora thermophila]|uniref:anaerobic ribonucleoside-triphosphate reductase n=1 Tax=Desulfurispora thermophila TaxID=265470 RepID=UPI000380741E|nr:anaerobic ribonucleoside-triphosphate reductase [Desulfurispora thermophila]